MRNHRGIVPSVRTLGMSLLLILCVYGSIILPVMVRVLYRVQHQRMMKERQNHLYKVGAGALDGHLRKGGSLHIACLIQMTLDPTRKDSFTTTSRSRPLALGAPRLLRQLRRRERLKKIRVPKFQRNIKSAKTEKLLPNARPHAPSAKGSPRTHTTPLFEQERELDHFGSLLKPDTKAIERGEIRRAVGTHTNSRRLRPGGSVVYPERLALCSIGNLAAHNVRGGGRRRSNYKPCRDVGALGNIGAGRMKPIFTRRADDDQPAVPGVTVAIATALLSGISGAVHPKPHTT